MSGSIDSDKSVLPPVSLLRGASLFLDFDGTLVDIAPHPDAIEVTHELRELLGLLHDRLGGRVAVLSGRPASDLEQLLDPVPLAIGGHHGLETRAGGAVLRSAERPAVLDSIVEELRQLEESHPGVLVEDKPLGVALHYRRAPQAEQACRAAMDDAARRSGLELQPGKMVIELKLRGADKGKALRELMGRPPFAGTRPLFLGDDLTDEPGFEAAQALGGAGIVIGERQPTAARYRLPSVREVLGWLRRAADIAR
jgi:trehalose 6-phosphate phosphatase